MKQPDDQISPTSVTVHLVKDRETPGTVRFKEVTDEEVGIGTLYIKKWLSAQLGNPEALTVTVAVRDDE